MATSKNAAGKLAGKPVAFVGQAALSTYAGRAYPAANHTHHVKNAAIGNYVQAPNRSARLWCSSRISTKGARKAISSRKRG